MIAAWMIEASVAALLFAAGAAAAQRVFALYRGVPLRWIWAGALAATFVVSAVWLVPGAPAVAGVAARTGVAAPTVRPAPPAAPAFTLPPVSPAVERGLLVAWATASAALAGLLLFAFARLAREHRRLEDGVVSGAAVGLSESLGPAAVGVLRPRVVIPRWVLGLDEAAQQAIVAHEREHQRTRDPALLVAGLLAVVAMPWNAGVWLAWRGLRLAVEFDCDERVLARGVDRGGYARVLLGAWSEARARWLPSAALLGTSGLGSRVQHLMRPEPRRRGMKAFIGAAAVVVLVFAACETPAPQRVAGPPAPSASHELAAPSRTTTDPLVIIDGVVQEGSGADLRTTQEVALTKSAAGSDRAVAGSVASAAATMGSEATTVRLRASRSDAVSANTTRILSRVRPDSIASVEILKGNAATAKYGARALNGVIIITTKGAARDTLHM